MRHTTSIAREAAEDLFFGQVVMIWARWFVIGGAATLSLWGAPSEWELATSIGLVVGLMAVNFFLHARQLTEQPANRLIVIAASLLDLLAVTVMTLTWAGQQGLDSRYFVFYYPVVFAFALVFPPRLAGAFTILALGLYAWGCLLLEPAILTDADRIEPLVMRLITLAALGGLGAYYWRIQRDRRRHGGWSPSRRA